MPETKDRARLTRFRPKEDALIVAAAARAGETFSTFMRIATLERARELAEPWARMADNRAGEQPASLARVWDNAQQRHDNAVIDAIHAGLGSSEDDA